MSGQKLCVFVQGRLCPFPTQELPLQTCQVCVEAWKTELTMKAQSQATEAPLRTLTVAHDGSVAEARETLNRLNELDELFMGDNLDPMDYVRLRKEHIGKLASNDRPRLVLEALDGETAAQPTLRDTRLVLVVRSFLGDKTHTYPQGWDAPEALSEGVIDQLFKLAESKKAEDIRAGAGGYRFACVRHGKGKLLLMVLDGDEEFETYEDEIRRLSKVFKGEGHWVKTLREMRG
ncbi:MAG: hypothetical protein ABIJ47_08475 [Candidatus Bathyarchaeota archaeon]